MDYTTSCHKCSHEWDQSHPMKEAHEKCPKCGCKEVYSLIHGTTQIAPPLDRNWESLNGGRGQYFSQLETSKTCTRSPENYFRSRNEAIEACKRRGWDIIDK